MISGKPQSCTYLCMRRLCDFAGAIHVPVPPPPAPSGPGGLKDVVALLVPFLQPTPQDIANNLLYYYVQYHLQLGFTKFVQYTQVQLLPRLLLSNNATMNILSACFRLACTTT